MRRHFSGGFAASLLLIGATLALTHCGSSDGETSEKLVDDGQAGSSSDEGHGPKPLFVLPTSLESFGQGCSIDGRFAEVQDACVNDFFDHPFPSDFRRDGDGRVRFAGYPNPNQIPLLKMYIEYADKLLDGFSPIAAGHVRFDGAIDPSTLPKSPDAATKADATVQLIDVDDVSPEQGQRRPITLEWRAQDGVYWLPNTLAFAPTFGHGLRPHTRYALVVTTGVKAADGGELGRSANLDAVLGLRAEGTDAGAAALHDAWTPALAKLEAAGVAAKDIAHLSVFTTGAPAEELFAIRDHVRESFPAPTAKNWTTASAQSSLRAYDGPYEVYQGDYGPSPDYQSGKLPFAAWGDGGAFGFEGGKPKVQREFDLRFALAVPNESECPMPEGGYPIVLYAHGTGGDFRSFIDDRTAGSLAKQCIASMGVDQIFHGTRPGAPPADDDGAAVELLFFNFQNPAAARTNGRQSAIDEVQRARLFTESHMTVPSAVSKTGKEIRFDGSKVMFYGHSQGGQNGPLYLSIDDSARGGVLSGSGGVISITLLEKSLPLPAVSSLVKMMLGVKATDSDELTPLHPAISLVQSLVDTVDPINYVSHILREPRPGFAPKSIYQTEGVRPDFTGDSYTPPHSIEVLAVQMGLPLMKPFQHYVSEMDFGGPSPIDIPAGGVAGNLAAGKASGVLAQFVPPGKSDGHFVVFNVPAATVQAAQFCGELAASPVGRVPALQSF